MAENYTGVKVVEYVEASVIDELYKEKKLHKSKIGDITLYPNMFLVLKSPDKKSALVSVGPDSETTYLLDTTIHASDIRPKNKEQIMAMNILMDPEIELCILTGRAGTGKTLISIAAALQQVEDGIYERLIITRPMSQVGKYDLGALPGTVEEKIGPYLLNYTSNLEQIVGRKATIDAMQQLNIEVIPLQLIRGASFTKAFIIADECQILDHHEMLTLGTRLGEGSKLVIMGDLNQRDEKIAKNKTGVWKIMEDERMKKSPIVGAIELQKVERSRLALLFSEVFENE